MSYLDGDSRVTSERDLIPPAILIVGAGGVLAVAIALSAAAAVTTVVLGGGWAWPPTGRWLRALWDLIQDPGDPARAFGPPWSANLAGHPALFWTVASLIVLTALGAVAAVAVAGWKRYGPVPAGHAARGEVAGHLSLAQARRTAQWTRPDLSADQRRHAEPWQIAVPMNIGPDGTPLYVPFDNSTGTLAPTQSGKSRRDLAHKAIAAPGALLCSTTKADLLEFTAAERARRFPTSPVLAFDATGHVAWPGLLRWSPLHGCADPDVALRRAHTMVEAAAAGKHTGTGNDRVFRDRAKQVLQAYFVAAARAGYGVDRVVRWATARPADLEPVTELRTERDGLVHEELARNLRAEIGMVKETSDAVWMSVRRVVEPFMDPRIQWLCSPPAGRELDMEAFIAARGSLYLIAGENQAVSIAPVLTALVEQWMTTAQAMSLATPYRRLAPPATAILDEVTNATPVPQLPNLTADTAGRGVIIHWAAQSVAALETAYPDSRWREVLDTTTTLSVWGGLKDQRTLEWVSTLAGHYERHRRQTHSQGWSGPSSSSIGSETVPVYRPGDVRGIPKNKVLVIHRHLRPILSTTLDVSDRPDWARLQVDVALVRAGRAHVDTDGLLRTIPGDRLELSR